MSELEKAKQIAAEAFNFNSKAYTTIEQQNEIIEVNRKAFMKIISLPSLTIPKSIADELDRYDFELTSTGLTYRNMDGTLSEFFSETNYEIPQLITQTITGNYRIVFAYLAGKALGVDLVKVVEGLNESNNKQTI